MVLFGVTRGWTLTFRERSASECCACSDGNSAMSSQSSSPLRIMVIIIAFQTVPVMAMPEYGEAVGQVTLVSCFITYMSIRFGVEALRLKNIWLDCIQEEQDYANAHPTQDNALQRLGLPYPLTPTSDVRRGASSKVENRPMVWPTSVTDLSKLVLVDIIPNPRNVILNFATRCVQVSLLHFSVMFLPHSKQSSHEQVQLFTHTLPQIFSLDDWYHFICRIPKQVSGISLGLYILLPVFFSFE